MLAVTTQRQCKENALTSLKVQKSKAFKAFVIIMIYFVCVCTHRFCLDMHDWYWTLISINHAILIHAKLTGQLINSSCKVKIFIFIIKALHAICMNYFLVQNAEHIYSLNIASSKVCEWIECRERHPIGVGRKLKVEGEQTYQKLKMRVNRCLTH